MLNSAKPCRFWNPDSSEAPWPLDWAVPFQMRIKVSHLWIMGAKERAEFGFVCLLEDAMPQQIQHAFPFGKPYLRKSKSCQE